MVPLVLSGLSRLPGWDNWEGLGGGQKKPFISSTIPTLSYACPFWRLLGFSMTTFSAYSVTAPNLSLRFSKNQF